jgi:Kef-type K+ transport system membrane component KefB
MGVRSVEHGAIPSLILVLGGLIIASLFLKSWLERVGLPPLVGFLGLGLLLRLADDRWAFLSEVGHGTLGVLAGLGVIALLFRVGLESDLAGLVKQLRRASVIWVASVLVSGAAGFAVTHWALSQPVLPSVFVAVAMTATSVGVPMAVWQDAGALKSPTGELLIDTAEMDDLSGVVLMAILFGVAPMFAEGTADLAALGKTLAWVLARLAGFMAFCYLFSRYVEKRVTHFFQRMERGPDPMITVAGMAIVTAALAGLLGFSVAIGAFFAGLVFSRDPEAVRMEASFQALHDLFVPFFFIGIGLAVSPSAIPGAAALGLALAAAAIAGKVVGAGGPALLWAGGRGAALIGLSMVPRAEIAMIIMERGRTMGDGVVPADLFGSMAMVVVVTCVAVPPSLRPMLARWGPAKA